MIQPKGHHEMKHQADIIRKTGLTASSLKTGFLIFSGSLSIAIAAQISVPMFPVPMTLQTLAISLIGLTFGAHLAAFTVLAYVLEGALGLPVFANSGAGIAKLMGPTSGFIWGFIGMAFLTGYLMERGLSKSIGKLFIAAVVPAALLYVPGVLVLWSITPLDYSATLAAAVLPFVLGDVIKSAIAAFLVVSGKAIFKKS
jgi:biotin transport system substrate-specific component